ncbi:MAG: aldolase [Acidobacteriia bacterium]|nr:aldolase [Terriglobia bacterium]
MKDSRFQKVVAAGGIPVGHMVWEFGTRGIAKILESTGIDFVFIDMEHSAFDTERVADLLAWFKATDIAPFVRVPQGLYHFIARIMDAGALGVMVACVESAGQAKQIVDAAKYAPLGNRGVGLGGAHTDYVLPDPIAYFKRANENSTVICMIESPAGLTNLEAIASTPGVDMLWVGHYDLSQAMGIPGEFQNPKFLAALQSVVDAARKYHILAGMQPGNMEQAEQWLKIGFNVISWRVDAAVYAGTLHSEIEALRKRLNR